MFTSPSCSHNLRQRYHKRRMTAGDHVPDWVKSLAEKLCGLSSAPALAGLGALAVAILIDVVSSSPPEESTKGALRSVLAEQKASEVWDLVDECLKRCAMHINSTENLRRDIERLESQLSAALTRLKNSMVRDGHMSSEALKAWVNGAAFHIQMLIHQVRLGGAGTCDPLERLLHVYRSDLDVLFDKHEETIKSTCERLAFGHGAVLGYILVDESYREHLQVCYDQRYGRQKERIQQYFSKVEENLQQLVSQTGFFHS